MKDLLGFDNEKYNQKMIAIIIVGLFINYFLPKPTEEIITTLSFQDQLRGLPFFAFT